jgi:hypothetical protein
MGVCSRAGSESNHETKLTENACARVQVTDLGCAKQLQEGERTFTLCGTMDYLCPEIILMKGHGTEADLWQVRFYSCYYHAAACLGWNGLGVVWRWVWFGAIRLAHS